MSRFLRFSKLNLFPFISNSFNIHCWVFCQANVLFCWRVKTSERPNILHVCASLKYFNCAIIEDKSSKPLPIQSAAIIDSQVLLSTNVFLTGSFLFQNEYLFKKFLGLWRFFLFKSSFNFHRSAFHEIGTREKPFHSNDLKKVDLFLVFKLTHFGVLKKHNVWLPKL